MTAPNPDLTDQIIRAFQPDLPDRIAVAVSGGSDSMGLLVGLRDWRSRGGPDVFAVTVDHGLRDESAAEAQMVAARCAQWNIAHETLAWGGDKSVGNLPDQARRARYQLMAAWAVSRGIKTVALGHTLDDQAETFLMRLGRSAGVDGLAAMRPDWRQDGVRFVRPVLDVRRETLRDRLRAEGVEWVNDPSNQNLAYIRTRARTLLPELGQLGITPQALSEVAGHMADARRALDAAMYKAVQPFTRVEMGDVVTDQASLLDLDPELVRRFLLRAMQWITYADYPPRAPALARVIEAIRVGRPTTLHGVYLYPSKGNLRLTREWGAVADLTVQQGQPWDERWEIHGPDAPDAVIAALGEKGLRYCPDRALGVLPATSLTATPALWQGDTLLAAPLARLENGYRAKLLPHPEHRFAERIAH